MLTFFAFAQFVVTGTFRQSTQSSLLQATVTRSHVLEKSVPQAGSLGFRFGYPRAAAVPSEEKESLLVSASATSTLADGSENLCIELPGEGEYLAPEFLLIGAEKAATSSFYLMFNNTGIVYPNNMNGMDSDYASYPLIKELFIFNSDRFDKGLAFWLHHFPACSRTDRMVAVEFTPTYISHPLAAQRMKQFYGDRTSQLKFGVILRDPLHRAHSAFYFYMDGAHDRRNGCAGPLCDGKCVDTSFKQYVLDVVRNGTDPCTLFHSNREPEGWHGGGGDYAVQLQSYFDVFNASQFTVFLFRHIVNDSDGIAGLWRSLGLQADVAPPAAPHFNEGQHPSLEEDLDSDAMREIQAYLQKTMGADQVADVLTASPDKPVFVGYDGDGGKESVTAWIQSSW